MKGKKILVLTNIYPDAEGVSEATPVVHYFAREWVKMGYEVRVAYYAACFPMIIRLLLRILNRRISAKAGYAVSGRNLPDRTYALDGVRVNRIRMKKRKPHACYSEAQLEKAFEKTLAGCRSEHFVPDVILSHWPNPMLDIMARLKAVFSCRTCYVAHAGREIDVYGDRAEALLRSVDTVGFRSAFIRDKFLQYHSYGGPVFPCYSGIPEKFLPDAAFRKAFDGVKSFVYVGTLIERKYPEKIVEALKLSFGKTPFSMTYIGRGAQESAVRKAACGVEECVHLSGRMEREAVMEQLKQADVFVMISRDETFGLVYLEAMAAGCITVASRNEGFDGIIRDGENGFLCKAGDEKELADVISRIRSLSGAELQRISLSAMETARELTDYKAAEKYIESVI